MPFLYFLSLQYLIYEWFKESKYYIQLWHAKTFNVIVSLLRRNSSEILFLLWFPYNIELFLFQALDKIKEIAVEIKKDDQE